MSLWVRICTLHTPTMDFNHYLSIQSVLSLHHTGQPKSASTYSATTMNCIILSKGRLKRFQVSVSTLTHNNYPLSAVNSANIVVCTQFVPTVKAAPCAIAVVTLYMNPSL